MMKLSKNNSNFILLTTPYNSNYEKTVLSSISAQLINQIV